MLVLKELPIGVVERWICWKKLSYWICCVFLGSCFSAVFRGVFERGWLSFSRDFSNHPPDCICSGGGAVLIDMFSFAIEIRVSVKCLFRSIIFGSCIGFCLQRVSKISQFSLFIFQWGSLSSWRGCSLSSMKRSLSQTSLNTFHS